jgi:hypothetical protein
MIILEIVKIFTASCGLITGFLILYDSRLQAHPGKLVALIALCQGSYILSYNFDIFQCLTGIYKMTSRLTF